MVSRRTSKSFSVALLAIILGVVLQLLPIFCLHAEPCLVISQIDSTSGDKIRIEDTIDEINQALAEKMELPTFMTYEFNNDALTIKLDTTTYNNLSQKSKQELMEICLVTIQNSSISSTNRNKIYNFISDSDPTVSKLVRQLSSDVTADFAEAYMWLRPFTSPLSVFLGVLSILIFVLLGLSIVVDIAFIVIPGFQWLLLRSTESKKPPFISIEAWDACKEAESHAGSGRTPLQAYFKSKVKEYVVLAICLLYLVSGEIYTLVGILVDYFQGLLPK